MSVEITTLEQPIDAMYLIHKALRGEADRTVATAFTWSISISKFSKVRD